MEELLQSEFTVRVIAIDEHPIFIDGLRNRLGDIAKQVEIVAELHDVDDAYQLVATLKPDLILMGIAFKYSTYSSIEIARKIKQDFPQIKILILSSDDSIDSIMGALRAGANGYLLKSISISDLKGAIFNVMSGGSVLCPTVAQKLLEVLNHPVSRLYIPTTRELDILGYVALGETNKEIARNMFLSPRTVEVHLSHIFQKLGVSSRTECVLRAISLGLVPSPEKVHHF